MVEGINVLLFFQINFLTDFSRPSIKDEVRSVMRPLNLKPTNSRYADYNSQVSTPRRGKGKHSAPSSSSSKAKRATTFKNVNIMRYTGPSSPHEFGRKDSDIVCTFFYELSPFSSGDEVMEGICQMARESFVEGFDFSLMTADDMEFVKCSGKTCRVPRTVPGFVWSPDAIKSVAGQGDIYIRLCKDFPTKIEGKSGSSQSINASCMPQSQVPVLHSSDQTSSSCLHQPSITSVGIAHFSNTPSVIIEDDGLSDLPSTSSLQALQSTSFVHVDLTQSESNSPRSDDDDQFPIFSWSFDYLTRESLYEIFGPKISQAAINEVLNLTSSDTMQAFKVFINGPKAADLLQLHRRSFMRPGSKKLRIDEDLFEEALVFYKHPSFDPRMPLRISFKGQPAIDTGGLTRQFFSDVLKSFACQDVFQLFTGPPNRLRPAYSPQVLPLMKLLGLVLGHSLLHEGPGFPFFAPFVYWYLVTGSEERSLPYVQIEEDLSCTTGIVVNQVCYSCNPQNMIALAPCNELSLLSVKPLYAYTYVLYNFQTYISFTVLHFCKKDILG